ncbi:---NA--- [Paramuricea clavata]|uniref:---NA n=1 Tax=Paramuricea clavata TaxID=317549 RepID=A0A7D9JKX5_PARCT|nr:---NA--- [Paramuricea clavata]
MSTTLTYVAAGFSAHLGPDIKSKDDAFQYAMSTRRGQVYPQKIDIKILFSHCHDIVMPMPFYHYIQVFGEEFERYQIDPFVSKNYSVSDIKKEFASYCGVHPSCQTLMYQGKELDDHLSLTQVRHALNTINFMLQYMH